MDPVSQAFVAIEAFKVELAAVKKQLSGSAQLDALVRSLAVRLGVVERRPPDRIKQLEERLDGVELRLRGSEVLTSEEEHERETEPPPAPAAEQLGAEQPGSLLDDVVSFLSDPEPPTEQSPPPE